MVNLSRVRLQNLVDVIRRIALRPAPGTRYRCEECGARVGRQCADPFCYGSLGGPPSPAATPRRRRR